MWSIVRTATSEWFRHRSARLGAALAYYSVFSLGPLLLIVVGVAGLFFGQDAVRQSLTGQFRELLGETGSQAVETMLRGAGSRQTGMLSAIVGAILLIVAALGVVVQLKDALNAIWEVEENTESGWWAYLRTYLVSLAGVLALGFLLAVSLIFSAGLAAFSAWLGVSAGENIFWQAVNFVVSLVVLGALFALLFRFFPDTRVEWAEVWPSALATALLFNLGKLAISWYIGAQGLESTYGGAASIVVLLIWVYYSAQILLFGAELSHAHASRRRSAPGLRPAAGKPPEILR
jgi:membrane protein